MKQLSRWRPTRTQLGILLAVVGVAIVLRLVTIVPVFRETPVDLLVLILLAWVVTIVLIGGYRLNWTWTGFGPHTHKKIENEEFHRGKTLWDWMQLLIVPSVLATAALSFNVWNANLQRETTDDNQREAALQAYFDKMTELLMSQEEEDSSYNSALRSIARTRTLTLLRRLDPDRQHVLIQFLRDSQVFSTTTGIITLSGADLRGIRLSGADLQSVDLSNADLTRAEMDGTNLSVANLNGATLWDTKLSGGNLWNANLGNANVKGARLDNANLSLANLSLTDLGGADLSQATLLNANLTNANLWKTKLVGTNLKSAVLKDATLNLADLTGAELSGANLNGANLRGAILTGADLSDADLTNAKVTAEELANVKSLRGAIMPAEW